MYNNKSTLNSSKHNNGLNFKEALADRTISRNSKFVFQVLKDESVIGGGPLMGSLREAQQKLEQMISNGELSQIYWAGITSVVMLDKEQTKITSYKLSK